MKRRKPSGRPKPLTGRRGAGKTGKRRAISVKGKQKRPIRARRKPPSGRPSSARIPAVAGPRRKESPRVQKLRGMLEAKQAEILQKIKRARADSLEVDRTSFPEVGDLVSASVEKEKAFESGEAGVNALREVAGALEKLKQGTYGTCEACGKPIGLKRLGAMPSARLCIRCKSREESTPKIAPSSAEKVYED